ALGGEPKDRLPRVEEAERSGVSAALLEDRAQRGLERLFGRRGLGRDVREPLRQGGLPRPERPRRLGRRPGPRATLTKDGHDLNLETAATVVPRSTPAHLVGSGRDCPWIVEKTTATADGGQRKAGTTRSAKRRMPRRSSTRPKRPMKCV